MKRRSMFSVVVFIFCFAFFQGTSHAAAAEGQKSVLKSVLTRVLAKIHVLCKKLIPSDSPEASAQPTAVDLGAAKGATLSSGVIDFTAVGGRISEEQFKQKVEEFVNEGQPITNIKLENREWVTDGHLKAISDIAELQTSITELDLDKCANLTDQAIVGIKEFTNLNKLHLRFCNGLENPDFTGFENLRDLYFNYCKRLKNPSLPKELKLLHLAECKAITDAILQSLPTGLESLYLYGCTAITDAGLKVLPKELKLLHLAECTAITDAGLKVLPKELELLGISIFTDATVKIINSFKNLKTLLISTIKDNIISRFPENIRSLSLYHCEELKSIANIPLEVKILTIFKSKYLENVNLELCTNLQTLDLEGCSKIMYGGIKGIENLEKLTNVDLSGTYVLTCEKERLLGILQEKHPHETVTVK
jgi:hypothetical protein